LEKEVNTLEEVCAELETYTELVSDEWQETVDDLISLTRNLYVFSDEFSVAVEEELRTILAYCKENAVFREEEIVTPARIQTVKVLKWTNE
jgi:hypothetical protein